MKLTKRKKIKLLKAISTIILVFVIISVIAFISPNLFRSKYDKNYAYKRTLDQISGYQ